MHDKLSVYHAKRNFGITREPEGRVRASQGELQFVVHRHDASRLHFDFRLEVDGVLKSWAVPKGPSLDPSEKRLAVQVEDHPLDYAAFEGVIPENQYGAGTVEIWDSGYWEPQGDPAAGHRAGKLKFQLYGGRLQGGWTLLRTRMPGNGGKEQWLLIKERDEAARSGGNADLGKSGGKKKERHPSAKAQARQSTKSAQEQKQEQPQAAPRKRAASRASSVGAAGARGPATRLAGAVEVPMPATITAQLATLADAPPAEGDWVYEVKYDGYRILARMEAGEVRMITRDGKDWTARLPAQVNALRKLGLDAAWLDGEIVVLDERGIPSFQQLQNAFDGKNAAQIVFFAFDLLYLNGYDLRAVPLEGRRGLLEKLLAGAAQDAVRYSADLDQPAQKLLDSACRLSMEGIIGKLRGSLYTGRRSAEWIKLKCRKRQEFVIAGFTDPQGKRQCFGSLLLAVYTDDGQLQYAGRVGTGFDTELLHSVHRQLTPLRQARCPFALPPKGPGLGGAHWLRPKLVAEISFAEWTRGGLLRQAVFHGLRVDKPAGQVRREEAAPIVTQPAAGDGSRSGARAAPKRRTVSRQADHAQPGNRSVGVKNAARVPSKEAAPAFQDIVITHPDRIIDASSGLTKLDLARYYDSVAPHILPYLKNRPVYLVRSPGGLAGKSFFQRHAIRAAIPGVEVLDPSVDPDHQPLMVINSPDGLLGAAQMGTFELHSCNATADLIDRPDCMVFDLDPDPALPWKTIVESARLTRQLLTELGLECFVKTSGSKGLHLVVPLARRHEWAAVTQFSNALAQHLADTLPSRFSATMGEENRVGRIYIDYLRNQKMASTVVPYSVRARPGLPVSAPVAWEELDDIGGSSAWTVATLPKRLAHQKQDPWAEFFTSRQILTQRMRIMLGIKKG